MIPDEASSASGTPDTASHTSTKVVLEREHFDRLFEALRRRNYAIVGPTVQDGSIVYDELNSSLDLPCGWTDRQKAGTYRLEKGEDDLLFGYTPGAHSWKEFLMPSAVRLWRAERDGTGFNIVPDEDAAPTLAFIGVRPCELRAIAIQDKVFLQSGYVDPIYRSRRRKAVLVAVNCGQAGGTCFCTSMGTGPKADEGFDLVLTEMLDDSRHYFTIEAGSSAGTEILEELSLRTPTDVEARAAGRVCERAAAQMGCRMETDGLKELLSRNQESPHWDTVATRCLSCANCTLVCPTCFCTTVEDTTDLTGDHAERWRKWDSCFTLDFSYIHGGSVRSSTQSRYRQWITHKLSTWSDQFGTPGCVGCGRCITWCPVAIDITEEVRALRASESARKAADPGKENDDSA